mmetsp:Transcript_34605/g.83021  ORF Transcript_34605/g.83021 Transcript_34605/m.83021 type:complete len:96 (-) Transcript_34605:134-421(-)
MSTMGCTGAAAEDTGVEVVERSPCWLSPAVLFRGEVMCRTCSEEFTLPVCCSGRCLVPLDGGVEGAGGSGCCDLDNGASNWTSVLEPMIQGCLST